jgi:hypothetical protein
MVDPIPAAPAAPTGQGATGDPPAAAPTAAPVAPAPASPPGESGSSAAPPSFRDVLPEDYKEHEAFTNLNSVEELAKAYTDALAQRPSAPQAGEYKLPENFPLKDFGEFASKSGFTQAQVDALLQYNDQQKTQQTTAFQEDQAQRLDDLLTTWGPNRDKNVNLARRAIRTFDTTDGRMANFLKAAGANNEPVVVEFLANLGRLLEESPYLKADSGGGPKAPQSPENVLYPNQANVN